MASKRPRLSSIVPILGVVLILSMTMGTLMAQAPCVLEGNGEAGIVDLPPEGCGYLNPNAVHMLVSGLPVGTELNLAVEHSGFKDAIEMYIGTEFEEEFDSELRIRISGTGILEGFRRGITIPNVEVRARTAGARFEGVPFNSDMKSIKASLPPGDPDFQSLTFTAGTDEVLASTGQVTLTALPDGTFQVDSFFDIEYEVEFIGAPGGALAGLSGTGAGTIHVEAFAGGPTPGVAAHDRRSLTVLWISLLAAMATVLVWRWRSATA